MIFTNLLKSFKNLGIKRKLLILLFASEVLVIAILLVVLSSSLSKYLDFSPQAFSSIVMNSKSRYVIRNGDFLSGKTIPKTKVAALITPGNIKTFITSDQEGYWSFQAPQDLLKKKYQLSIGYFDKSNDLAFFKTFKIRIKSANRLDDLKEKASKLAFFLPQKVQAEELSEESGAELIPQDEEPEVNEPASVQAVPQNPPNYLITIANIGSSSDTLNSGQAISPSTLVFDQEGIILAENNDFTLSYALENNSGESFNLINSGDCLGINICQRQIPDNLSPGYYNLVAYLSVDGQDFVKSDNTVSLSIGENQPLQKLSIETDITGSDQTLSYRVPISEDTSYGKPTDYLAEAEIFLNNDNQNTGVNIYRNIYRNLSQPEIEDKPRSITSINERFNIVKQSQGYFYTSYLESDGDQYDIPVDQVSIITGNLLNLPVSESQRKDWVGVRLNRVFWQHSAKENESYISDLNKLGVSKFRIVLNGAEKEEVDKVRDLLEIAARFNYQVILVYNPSARPSSEELNFNLAYLFSTIEEVGLPNNRIVFELGNEPDLCHYWQDFEITGNPSKKALLQKMIDEAWQDPAKRNCEIYGSLAQYEWRMDAFARFIRSSSEAIWKYDPNIKIIIGAKSIQGAGDLQVAKEELDNYIKIISQYVDLRKFDFAIHGYQTWFVEGSLGTVYEMYADTLKKYKSDQNNYIWITEVGMDLKDFYAREWVDMLNSIKEAKDKEALINSVIIHEFDGQTETANNELWQLRSNETEVKYPNYNVIQRYLTQP